MRSPIDRFYRKLTKEEKELRSRLPRARGVVAPGRGFAG